MEPQERTLHGKLVLNRTASALRRHGFATEVFDSGTEAAVWLVERVAPTDKVAYGGSRTVTELGILDKLRQNGVDVPVRDGLSADKRRDLERGFFSADVYLASANAISEDGSLVNIDLWGNRTGAIEFGPKKVYLIVGRNKVVHDLQAAIVRARQVAAVQNNIRFKKPNPCVKDGHCHDCDSPDRICSIMSVLMRSAPKERISVLLVNEDLGF